MAEDTSYSCTLDVAKRLIELESAKVAGKKNFCFLPQTEEDRMIFQQTKNGRKNKQTTI